ncbi:uncharacterized protein DS421_12g362450 [Arachis hypogaea]|nr:uncharacterized protein DS421_12g362450 [Arachis hypogaea]
MLKIFTQPILQHFLINSMEWLSDRVTIAPNPSIGTWESMQVHVQVSISITLRRMLTILSRPSMTQLTSSVHSSNQNVLLCKSIFLFVCHLTVRSIGRDVLSQCS